MLEAPIQAALIVHRKAEAACQLHQLPQAHACCSYLLRLQQPGLLTQLCHLHILLSNQVICLHNLLEQSSVIQLSLPAVAAALPGLQLQA